MKLSFWSKGFLSTKVISLSGDNMALGFKSTDIGIVLFLVGLFFLVSPDSISTAQRGIVQIVGIILLALGVAVVSR